MPIKRSAKELREMALREQAALEARRKKVLAAKRRAGRAESAERTAYLASLGEIVEQTLGETTPGDLKEMLVVMMQSQYRVLG